MNILRVVVLVVALTTSVVASATDISTNLGNLANPSSQNYGNTHSGTELNTTFYDDFVFTVTDATAGSFTAALNTGNLLGLSDLVARLYVGDTHYTTSIPSGVQVLERWGTIANLGSGVNLETVVLDPIQLAAGTYTMQIRGTVTGSMGGSYAGVLNITPPTAPVPETESGVMLLSGLLLIGLIASKKRSIL